MKRSKRWISLILVGILSTMSVSSALIVNAEEQNEYELQPAEKITAQLTDEINSSAVSDAKYLFIFGIRILILTKLIPLQLKKPV